MAIVLPQSNKIDNSSQSTQGKLSAREWNALVKAVAYLLGKEQVSSGNTIFLTESGWNALTENDTDYSGLTAGCAYAIYDDIQISEESSSEFNTATGKLKINGTYNTVSGKLSLTATYNTSEQSLTL